MLLGANADHITEMFTKMGRKAEVCRIFAQTQLWSATGSPWKAAIDANTRGEKVVLSFKSTIPNVVAGSEDARIKGIANGLVAAGIRDGVLIMYHEPEDNVARGEFTALQWRNAQKRLVSLVKPILGPSGWKVGTCLMGWTYDSRSGRNPEDYYVPEVDILTFDPYNTMGTSEPDKPWATASPATIDPATIFQCAAYAKSKGKPFGLAEVGCARREADVQGTERTVWWKKVVDSGVLSGAEWVCHFEMGIPDLRAEWAIRNEPGSLTEFKRLAVPPNPCAALETEVAALKVEVAALQEELNTTDEELTTADAEIAHLRTMISNARTALES